MHAAELFFHHLGHDRLGADAHLGHTRRWRALELEDLRGGFLETVSRRCQREKIGGGIRTHRFDLRDLRARPFFIQGIEFALDHGDIAHPVSD